MEKNFGTRVRQARHKAGLTQAALAEKLNVVYATPEEKKSYRFKLNL